MTDLSLAEKVEGLTKAQRERFAPLLQAVENCRNGLADARAVAIALGYRTASRGRFAVNSRLRIAERYGLVSRIPPRDQWDHARWSLTEAGRAALLRAKGAS